MLGWLPLRNATRSSHEQASTYYAQHALVLNVPLNYDLNYRFFEVMAGAVPRRFSAIQAWWVNPGTLPSGLQFLNRRCPDHIKPC
jgi:hypothetical protein